MSGGIAGKLGDRVVFEQDIPFVEQLPARGGGAPRVEVRQRIEMGDEDPRSTLSDCGGMTSRPMNPGDACSASVTPAVPFDEGVLPGWANTGSVDQVGRRRRYLSR